MTGGSNISALKTALAAAEARAANAEAEIAFLKLTYGWRSERKQRLLDQLELQLDELEASATEDELAAEQAAAGTTQVKGFTRRKPARKPFPAHLPRARGGAGADILRLLRLGEAVEDRRGRDRDAGGHPAPLREDLPAAGAAPRTQQEHTPSTEDYQG